MNPEIYGYLMERLFAAGALDVFWVPVYMKKNRPGTMLKVVCKKEKQDQLTALILSETTTLGLRSFEATRDILHREAVDVETVFGNLPAKKIINADGTVRVVPEYEVCRKVAQEKGVPLRQVYEACIGRSDSDD